MVHCTIPLLSVLKSVAGSIQAFMTMIKTSVQIVWQFSSETKLLVLVPQTLKTGRVQHMCMCGNDHINCSFIWKYSLFIDQAASANFQLKFLNFFY